MAVEPGMPVDDLVKKLAEKGIVISKGMGEEGESRMVKVHDLPVYIDLRTSLEYLKKNETPFTPSTGSFRVPHGH